MRTNAKAIRRLTGKRPRSTRRCLSGPRPRIGRFFLTAEGAEQLRQLDRRNASDIQRDRHRSSHTRANRG